MPGSDRQEPALAAAAIRQATIANRKAACSPSRNGAEIRLGKEELPVRIDWLWAESPASTWDPSKCWIGS
jgi:hypothetical protein